jgi:hypothetical protein
MSRTTVDIDDPVLREVKALQKKEKRSLGRIITELLADALALRRTRKPRTKFVWVARPMNALVDLSDKEAVHAALDREDS